VPTFCIVAVSRAADETDDDHLAHRANAVAYIETRFP
jgi:hypothetical protein